MFRNVITFLLLLAVGALVFLGTRSFYKADEQLKEEISATVLLERLRPVLKLITVEGDFNEIYHHKDSWNYHSMVASLPAFQKEALVRVKARVSIGYDLEGMSLKADQESRTITLFAPDDPQILSVEHDVDYYDLKEGLFNSFSPRELTRLTGKAKQQVIEKVPMTGLFHEAHRQRDDMIGMMRGIAETAGWKLELGDRHNALALDRKL